MVNILECKSAGGATATYVVSTKVVTSCSAINVHTHMLCLQLINMIAWISEEYTICKNEPFP